MTESRDGEIYMAMISVMRDIGAIGKDQKNLAQGFKFRGIDQVYNALNSNLARHGVFTIPTVLSSDVQERTTNKGTIMAHVIVRMRYRFTAIDGSYIDAVTCGEALDSGDKAFNKAMSVAHKYAFLQIFAIPTEEEKDPDYQTHELMSNKRGVDPNIDLPVPEYCIPFGAYRDRPLSTMNREDLATVKEKIEKGFEAEKAKNPDYKLNGEVSLCLKKVSEALAKIK